jgi:hypothetical protein
VYLLLVISIIKNISQLKKYKQSWYFKTFGGFKRYCF